MFIEDVIEYKLGFRISNGLVELVGHGTVYREPVVHRAVYDWNNLQLLETGRKPAEETLAARKQEELKRVPDQGTVHCLAVKLPKIT